MGFLTETLDALVDRMPVAHGRAGKELAQIVAPPVEQVKRIVEFRAGQGFFARNLDVLRGKDRRRQEQIDRGLVANQHELQRRLDELRRRGVVLDIDVARIAGHLRRAQLDVADLTTRADAADTRFGTLASLTAELADLVTGCERRLDRLDESMLGHARMLTLLDAQAAGTIALDLAVGRWSDGRSYPRLPPACQLLMLALETAGGPCGRFEQLAESASGHRSDDPYRPAVYFRDQLIRQVLADPRADLWTDRRPLVDVLTDTATGIAPDDAEPVAEILGARLHPALRTPHGPLVVAVRDVLDLRAGGERIDRERAGAVLEAARAAGGPVPLRLSGAEYVREVVAAVARAELRSRRAFVRGGLTGAAEGGAT